MERIKLPRIEVIYKDLFHMKTFYMLCHEWLEENGFLDQFGGHEYIETFYDERRLATGRELRFWWRVQKNAKNPYFRYRLNVDFFIITMKEREIMRNNKKFKANIAEINVWITPILEKDVKTGFAKSGLLKNLKRRFFEPYVYKKDIEFHIAQVLDAAHKYEAEIKTHLNMRNFVKERVPYIPKFKKQ